MQEFLIIIKKMI